MQKWEWVQFLFVVVQVFYVTLRIYAEIRKGVQIDSWSLNCRVHTMSSILSWMCLHSGKKDTISESNTFKLCRSSRLSWLWSNNELLHAEWVWSLIPRLCIHYFIYIGSHVVSWSMISNGVIMRYGHAEWARSLFLRCRIDYFILAHM